MKKAKNKSNQIKKVKRKILFFYSSFSSFKFYFIFCISISILFTTNLSVRNKTKRFFSFFFKKRR